LRIRDIDDRGTVAGEDAAHPRRAVRTKGNRAGLVHRRTQRTDRRERTKAVRDGVQLPVAEEEDTLAPARKVSVEACDPRIVQVRVARDTGQKGAACGLHDL